MTDFISALISFLGTIFDILNYIIIDIAIIVQIIINPFLLLMLVFTIAHFYTLLMSHTRKELIINYFIFFKHFSMASFNIIKAIIPVIIGIIQSIATIIQGVLSAPNVNILGFGVAPGTLLAIAIVLLFSLYTIFSF